MLTKLLIMLREKSSTNHFDSSKQASLFWRLSDNGDPGTTTLYVKCLLYYFAIGLYILSTFFSIYHLTDKC